MKVGVVAPVGYSPPVVTEFLQYLEEGLGRRVSDLTVIATSEEKVLEGVELIRMAVKYRYPHIHFHVVRLPFKDIRSEEDSYRFMEISASLLRSLKVDHRVETVYLCVAGGRKDMCIILSLLAQLVDVEGVYHVVMQDVKVYNLQLERLRYEIERLAEAEDKDVYYMENREAFENLMYPPLNAYTVIKIPVIPYPREALKEVAKLITRKTLKGETKLSYATLKALEKAGLVRVGKTYVYPAEQAEKLARILEAFTSP